ncbi:hypothetical protein ACJX0J_009991 [Zea mays]
MELNIFSDHAVLQTNQLFSHQDIKNTNQVGSEKEEGIAEEGMNFRSSTNMQQRIRITQKKDNVLDISAIVVAQIDWYADSCDIGSDDRDYMHYNILCVMHQITIIIIIIIIKSPTIFILLLHMIALQITCFVNNMRTILGTCHIMGWIMGFIVFLKILFLAFLVEVAIDLYAEESPIGHYNDHLLLRFLAHTILYGAPSDESILSISNNFVTILMLHPVIFESKDVGFWDTCLDFNYPRDMLLCLGIVRPILLFWANIKVREPMAEILNVRFIKKYLFVS